MFPLLNFLFLALTLSPVSRAEKPFQNLQFGLASAPGQAEDGLDDIWRDWGKKGKIAAYQNVPFPEDRLRFWSHPEVEIDMAARTGIQIYRFGVDWGRVMPAPHQFDQSAIDRYRLILKMIKGHNMKIMLTLMHHSIPVWAQNQGGWLHDEMKDHFLEFAKRMMEEFHSDVDYWISFNEGNSFSMMAYTAGIWPPGEKRPINSLMYFGPFKGSAIASMDRMADAHNDLYDWAHQKFPKVKMGLALNMAYYTAKTWYNRILSSYTDLFMNWRFPERTRGHLDYFGFNYYGAEWIKGSRVDIDPEEEYSEAGRAIYPEGLYRILKEIHARFKLPIMITENGIADATDLLRPAYMVEHLKVVEAALKEGIPIQAYIFWTLSDNIEWSDGYCPKFGLLGVDRAHDFRRIPRRSYHLFQAIIKERQITKTMRDGAWDLVVRNQGKPHPLCRGEDGITSLSEPVSRLIIKKDWRFRPEL